ncbi:MAG: SRPBCC family protein [Caldimonas sp.]
MRILKWVGGVIVGLVVLLVVVGWFLPATFTVVRAIEVAAPPDKVYALAADPRGWKEWSAWNKRDPQMQIVYSGAASGAGAKWQWKSKSQGDGAMTLTAAEPGRRVAFDLYFPDFGTTSKGELRFEPSGTGTHVTWTMNGDMGTNPVYHWFALSADRMVGKDFDEGLAGLKVAAEKP